MSELINEHVKSEFKRFFEYVFKCNPAYWQELSGWEILGKVKTSEEDKLFNRLINNVVRSEDNLKRIINDSNLNSAQELKYYAYLFLKDMGKVDAILEIKLPEVPERFASFAEVYDRPSKLMDIVRDPGKPIESRQQVLNRIKELMPRNNLPTTIFDREVFNRDKWNKLLAKPFVPKRLGMTVDEWQAKDLSNAVMTPESILAFMQANAGCGDRVTEGLAGHGEYKNIDKNFYLNKIQEYARCSAWDAVSLYTEGYIKATNEMPTVYYVDKAPPSQASSITVNAYGEVIEQHRPSKDELYKESVGFSELRTSNKLREVINEEWAKHRKEQDEEFPALLAPYEKAMEVATFSDSAIARAGDYTDRGYIALKNKIGEVKANEIWNDPEQLLKAIEGKFSGEWKNIFATRLFEISIVTLAEQKRVMAGLLDIYEDMFFGESFAVPLVDTNIVEIVDKNLLGKEEEKKGL